MGSNSSYYYLIEIQFLGFRFHGWARQPAVKTVQGMINKTLKFVLNGQEFKTLGAGRTDAMVSSNQGYFELFLKEPIDKHQLLIELNLNLPGDIRAVSIEEADEKFNVIQDVVEKEYIYLFSFGDKNHPFAAPYMTYLLEPLDIELMKKGARLFEGKHDFREYCYQAKEGVSCIRTILSSDIAKNDLYTANFFPKESFVYKVKGSGFMRYQVRLMMGALFSLGKGELSLDTIRNSLDCPKDKPQYYIAPASGLILNKVCYEV